MKNNKKTGKGNELICYSEETVHRMMDILNQIEVRGVTNVTGLSAVMNLLNSVEKTIPRGEKIEAPANRR